MAKKLNVEEIDNALKRAARVAISGNDEQRSGRLMVREANSGRFVSKDKKPDSAKKR